MKKTLSLIVALIVCIMFFACSNESANNTSEEPKKTEVSSISKSEPSTGESVEINMEESLENVSEENSRTEIERTWPYVTGTFIQPGASFDTFTVKQWKNHLDGLSDVGIDTIIVQWIATTPYGEVQSVLYPSEKYSTGSGINMLPNLLEAAKQAEFKVFVGLNISDEWWSLACTNENWNKKQSDIGIDIAKEIYNLYKKDYPDELYGWYFAWEMFNGMRNNEKKAGEFLNMYLKPLTEIDGSMPLMLSPFLSSSGGNAEKAGEEWKKVFETADFREGDIFCCQDSVGAKHITIDELDGYFKALKEAVETEPGLKFWANSESFDVTGFVPAPISRFLKQLEIAKPYVDGFVTFAYSHYYAKDYGGHGGYHNAYKYYYDIGDTDVTLEKPAISAEYADGRLKVCITAKNNEAGIEKIVISCTDNDDYTKNIPVANLDKESYTVHKTYNVSENDEVTVTVNVYDYFGNVSESSETFICK